MKSNNDLGKYVNDYGEPVKTVHYCEKCKCRLGAQNPYTLCGECLTNRTGKY